MEYAMNGKHRLVRYGFLGVTALAASILGTSWVLYTRAGDGPARTSDSAASATGSQGNSVVCFGHVDVESGVTALYPIQPGRVAEVLAHEDDAVKAGAVLFRLDDR